MIKPELNTQFKQIKILLIRELHLLLARVLLLQGFELVAVFLNEFFSFLLKLLLHVFHVFLLFLGDFLEVLVLLQFITGHSGGI